MSNMILKVSFLVGTDIKDAIAEAKEKAIELDLAYVKFKFNGISISVRPNSDVDEAVELFRLALIDSNKFVVV